MEVIEFASTPNPDDVESILRRAQRAILNPTVDLEVFQSDETAYEPTTGEQIFSKDTIIVEIIGTDMDLTFIDLPGLIASVPVLRHMKGLMT